MTTNDDDDDGHIAGCDCDPIGTEADNSSNVMCDAVSGQCRCKPGVDGRQCDQCQPSHVNMSDTGCSGKFILALLHSAFYPPWNDCHLIFTDHLHTF